ncbi:hypothetical protein H6CHR_00235 [Variovorax sp. PBL-H6]|uniref:hypothetical protein n=1 Tax=Variovorax sp. PBL-H6 TaxID=434009 RepID=UPI00131658CC|nr:hypothetical protein [Variovorax sp. PBL-H6]VTU15452.1 hypothetical protein H6CHR_00235 [Variovorax sp. PBL-H6]
MSTMLNIERALAELDQALGSAKPDRRAIPFYGPTLLASMSEKDQAMALHAEQARYQQDPEASAVHFCLTAAISLLEVSQVLLKQGTSMTPQERERQWKTLVVYTKTAGRSAYRAASILADQKDYEPVRPG